MKKILCGLAVLIGAAILFSTGNILESRSNGNVIGRTGAPKVGGGNETTCSSPGCHGGTVNSGPNAVVISVTGNPNGFIPGQNYPMTVSIVNAGSVTSGFSVTCLNTELGFSGSFTPGSGTSIRVDPSSGRSYINHNTPGNGTWNFSWTAPLDNAPDSVTFYAAGRVASPNNIYTSKFIFRNANLTSTKNQFAQKSIIPYPNPATDRIIFSDKPVAYVIRSIHGLEVKSGQASGSESVSLEGLTTGIYLWEADHGGQKAAGQLVIR